MKVEAQILEGLKRLKKDNIFLGKVVNVDKGANMCVVAIEGLPVDALLQGMFAEKGMVIYPKVGSWVLLVEDAMTFYILMQSEVEAWKCEVLGSVFEQQGKGFVFKTDNEDLKMVLSDMLDSIGQMTVSTGVGPSGIPINKASFDNIKTRLDKLFV